MIKKENSSFDLLKRELKDKDEIISTLKQKLEVMESFHCSSSSFDALNSFRNRRNSSVVVIAEEEQIPSPTFKHLKQENSAKDKNNFRKKINQVLECDQYESVLEMVDDQYTFESFFPTSRSASIIPSFKQVVKKSFFTKKVIKTDELKVVEKRKLSFFRNLLSLFHFQKNKNSKNMNISENFSTSSSVKIKMDSLEDEDIGGIDPSLSYEAIISGQAPLDRINTNSIEKYLKWEDCIEWLGITKEQCTFLRSNSLEMRKRSVFLCADQLRFYSKSSHLRGVRRQNKMNTADEELFISVCTLFNESQFHVSAHRKNIQTLRKIHGKASGNSQTETKFLQAFCHCMHTILSMKKADDVSNKLMRFMFGFIVRSAEGINTAPQTSAFVERFVEGLMSHVLEHLDSKEKLVRSRLCQIMVACLNSVQELTDDIWKIFRIKMTERLFDKEAIVRVYAIHSMARLQGLAVEEDSELSILDIFLDLMQHDPSVDVRKAALLQIDVNPKSISSILDRRKDVDMGIRKLFYSKKMEEIDVLSLSIQQRDEILNSGLTDREASVKEACTDMIFENWIQKTNGNLIQFLAGLDVITNTKVAETALKHFFHKMPNMLNGNFNEQFLQSMTAEMGFILRVYCEHQISNNSDDRQVVQDFLPELIVLNGYVREKYNSIITCGDEVMKAELEFVINELLRVAALLDFSDEVGRRALFETIQEIMANLETSEMVHQTCIQIFMEHCSSTQEFLDIMTEFIGSFRDVYDVSNHDNDEIPDDIRIMANLRALNIIRNVFSIPDIAFAKNPILVAYLDEIVIQSVNSQFASVQASGLKCLGLCCTIEKALALEYMGLFCDFYRLGQEEGRITALQIIFDLVFLFGLDYFGSDSDVDVDAEIKNEGGESNSNSKIIGIVSTALYDPDEKIQNISAEGFAKLFLHRIIEDKKVLEGLFYLYLHPATCSSSPMKQCLSYFFQAYAFISSANQLVISSLIGKILGSWIRISRQSSSNESLVTLNSVSNHLLYLIDRSNLVRKIDSSLNSYNEMFAQIAVDLSWVILNDPLDESSKVISSIIFKLPLKSLSSTSPPLLKQLLFLQTQIMKYITDKQTINSIKRFIANILQLDAQDEPLDFEIINEMRAHLVKVLPAGIKTNNTLQNNNNGNGNAHPVSKKSKSNSNSNNNNSTTTNIMDDISDLLEDDN